MAANFSAEYWYYITMYTYYEENTTAPSQQFATQTTNGSGQVEFDTTDDGSPSQWWQIIPVSNNNGSYILRSDEAGPYGYLATFQGATTPIPCSSNYYKDLVHDTSFYWQFEDAGNGAFYMWNLGNTSAWEMARASSNTVSMSNVTGVQPSQQFWFTQGNKIIDENFFTYWVCSVHFPTFFFFFCFGSVYH
jgi:hypothetical protein